MSDRDLDKELEEARKVADEASHGHNEKRMIYAELRLFRLVMEAATEANRNIAERCLDMADAEQETETSIEWRLDNAYTRGKADALAEVKATVDKSKHRYFSMGYADGWDEALAEARPEWSAKENRAYDTGYQAALAEAKARVEALQGPGCVEEYALALEDALTAIDGSDDE